MSLLLEALRTATALPWNVARDPELSREAPPAHPEAGYLAAYDAFVGAVQDGTDVLLKTDTGKGYFVSLALGECSSPQRDLLFKAAHEAMAGRANTATELLRDFVKACAHAYANEEEGAYE